MKYPKGFQVKGLDRRFSIVFSLSKVYPIFNGALRRLNRVARHNCDPNLFYRIYLVEE